MMRRSRATTALEPTVAAAVPSEDTERIEAPESQTPRSGLSRRLLLTRGSMTMVAAGVVSALPAMPAAVNEAEAVAPEAESTIAEGSVLEGPLVAQLKDLHTGEISVFSGENEFSIFDRSIAARLFNAAK